MSMLLRRAIEIAGVATLPATNVLGRGLAARLRPASSQSLTQMLALLFRDRATALRGDGSQMGSLPFGHGLTAQGADLGANLT
jgi:hypothetical protein